MGSRPKASVETNVEGQAANSDKLTALSFRLSAPPWWILLRRNQNIYLPQPRFGAAEAPFAALLSPFADSERLITTGR